jgi:hypothetical protein
VTHCAEAATVNIPIAKHTKIRRISSPKNQCSAPEREPLRFGDRIAMRLGGNFVEEERGKQKKGGTNGKLSVPGGQ